MQDITRKAVRPSDSEEHVKFRSIQEDEYIRVNDFYNTRHINIEQLQKVFTALEEYKYVDKINHSYKEKGNRNTTSRIRPNKKLQTLFKQTKADALDVDLHMYEKQLLLTV